jgi:hypothetical protein
VEEARDDMTSQAALGSGQMPMDPPALKKPAETASLSYPGNSVLTERT